MRIRHLFFASLLAACAVLAPASAQQPISTITLLDSYLAGAFDEVARTFDERTDYGRLLKDLNRDADKWLAAGGESDRPRRELAAATFALEAARASEWYEWKWFVDNVVGSPTVYWKPPALLLEWGCELLRQSEKPRSIERTWQLAALAVAQRSEDPQFLIGNTEVDAGDRAAATAALAAATANAAGKPAPTSPPQIRGLRPIGMAHPDEVANIKDEIKHVMHVWERFPGENRFMLAQAIARERHTPADSLAIYQAIADDQWVGAEARTRLGGLLLRQNRVPDALIQFDRVERMTRDSYVLYLARLFRGKAFLRLKQEDNAMTALRGAVAVRPGMQSASVLLADLLIKNDLRSEAQALMAAVIANAGTYEPYLEYEHADDRFWPRLIAQLRAEIRR